MYQRHDPRDQHNNRYGRSEFRDYDEFQPQDNFEDQRHYNSGNGEYRTQPQPQQEQRRFRYTGSATTNAARRYQDQWSPDWVTRGGAPEYRRNSSGQGEMYGLRQDTSWDEGSYDTRQFDHQDEPRQFRGANGQDSRNPSFDSRSRTSNDSSGRGEFFGKGPKNYTRADQRMEEDINEQLTRHPYLDATDIEVKVKDGSATLTGTVRTKECKRTAEDIAEDVSGIKEVQNQLRVVPSQLISSSNQQPQQHASGGRQQQSGDPRSRMH